MKKHSKKACGFNPQKGVFYGLNPQPKLDLFLVKKVENILCLINRTVSIVFFCQKIEGSREKSRRVI